MGSDLRARHPFRVLRESSPYIIAGYPLRGGFALAGMTEVERERIEKNWDKGVVDFDMLYGHRRDIQGYYNALKEFDNALGEYIQCLQTEDALFITADHGNDPSFKGTDHTREYVPLLGYSPKFKKNVNLHIRETFADLGQTIAEMLKADKVPNGTSFLSQIIIR